MPTRTEAIKTFLEHSTHNDLANLYNPNMECQVNVAQDGGERTGGDFKGRRWHGWTDGATMWKSFRIPYSSGEYEDKKINFDLAEHCEGIGMTGWDWQNKKSLWVAYDFDALIGHSEKHTSKLTNEELDNVKQAAADIEWVTIRKSTSGSGLHLYVFLNGLPTDNHHEHAALSRAILGKMSALTAFDFDSRVDICGGNMWVWHRKMRGTDGLKVIKKGSPLMDAPLNWRDHIKVVTGRRRKNLPQDVQTREDVFEELAGQRPKTKLDSEHQKLIMFLKDEDALWWWDQDHHMLVTHTAYLEKAHVQLSLKGYFKTNSSGQNLNEQNCFAFPMRKGAWAIRRFSPGVNEHDSWTQDGGGWTRCYLNQDPDLSTAAKAHNGLETVKGGYKFREAETANQAAELLGVQLNIKGYMSARETTLKKHKDGRLIAEVERKDADKIEEMPGWLPDKNVWTKIFNTQLTAPLEPDVGNYDDMVRHLVTESGEDYGWMIKSDDLWRSEPLVHIRIALGSLGLTGKDTTMILGASVFKCWKVVNKPFQPEYPGDREWNRNAAQLKFLPTKDTEKLYYPTWSKIMKHCGSGLDDFIQLNSWAKANGIKTGAEYLECWVASLFQEPDQPLPYLFMHGPQNSGKSMFHEALSLLLTKGSRRADAALISQAGFNAELEGAIICIIEETDLKKNLVAYNRIKDWVTSRDLPIHCKGKTPYHIPNTTHWIQCANDHLACPIFPGDTRITMCYVESIDPIDMIPKKLIIPKLEKEAADFLGHILKIELPPSNDRLNVPVIVTQDKSLAQQLNQTHLQIFLEEKCKRDNGAWIKLSEFYDEFAQWLDPNEVHRWSKIRVGKELPPTYPKGRNPKDAQFYIGNIIWKESEIPRAFKTKLILGPDNTLNPIP